MIAGSAATRRSAVVIGAEIGKIAAFLRRDFLVAWNYRLALLSDMVTLVAQTVIFYFVSLMVDERKLPNFGSSQSSYMAFVAVGIALGTLLYVGMGRMASALRSEQLTGTLESLLMTPTSPLTIQLGLVAYDLLYIPIRTAVFLILVRMVFGVNFHSSGILPAVAIGIVFLPFVWGLGAASAAAVLRFRQVTGVIGLGGFALTVGSGAYFPLHLLPWWVAAVNRFNPIAMALDGVRMALLGGASWTRVGHQILPLAAMSMLTLAAGLAAFHLAFQKERQAGTLGIY